MAAGAPLPLFRSGLLDARTVALAGGDGPLGAAVGRACEALGAAVERYAGDPLDEGAAAGFVGAVVERHGELHVLVVDAAADFARAGLRGAADAAWVAARAAATVAMIEAGEGGKVVLLAPAPTAAPGAAAARAALENLARTLSIEWSRYDIRTTAILLGAETAPEEVGAVVAFLASPAGDYYSGCAFALGGAPG